MRLVCLRPGMMMYRSRQEFDDRFDWSVTGAPRPEDVSFEVENYMQYQGVKFSTSFDAK